MNSYSTGRTIGLMIGITIGLIVSVLVLKTINRNRKMRTEYDEMQKAIRNNGYRYAFYTVMILEALMCVLSSSTELPVHPMVIHFVPIFLGVVVQASYCIWKDAYVGLNTNLPRFLVFSVVISLFNLLIFFLAWKNGAAVEDGILQPVAINLLCGLIFAVLGIVALLKKSVPKEVEE